MYTKKHMYKGNLIVLETTSINNFKLILNKFTSRNF